MFLLDFVRSKLHRDEWQNETLAIMVRIISANTGNSLLEILSYFAPMYGEGSVLSLVDVRTREIIETTEPDKVAEIKIVALSIKEFSYGGYSMRHEKTGTAFRRDFNCVRYIPLTYRGSVSHMLLVEQRERQKANLEEDDRCTELLAIAVNIRIFEQSLKNAAFVDSFTKLPNREKMVRALSQYVSSATESSATICLGLLSFFKEDIQSDAEYEKRTGLMLKAVEVAKKHYSKEIYLVSDGCLGFVSVSDLYVMNGVLYDILEHCLEIPELSVKGIVASVREDARKSIYLCENALSSADEGVIDILRAETVGGRSTGGLHHDTDGGDDDGESAYVFESSFSEVEDT